ncbi:hypothetical protein, partial [Enterobacter hormaechei]|uniref:hypothetical protein n=1 Tax=Enterobacter hormaechei TaxID=158836 RepID=UPI00197ABF17
RHITAVRRSSKFPKSQPRQFRESRLSRQILQAYYGEIKQRLLTIASGSHVMPEPRLQRAAPHNSSTPVVKIP